MRLMTWRLALVAGALALSLGGTPLWAQEPTSHVLQEIQYNVKTGELILKTADGTALHPEKVLHRPRQREITFLLPQTTVTPLSKTIAIETDPVVKTIQLQQRTENAQPAVQVRISLRTQSPYVPFMMVPGKSDLRLVMTRQVEGLSPAGAAAPITKPATSPAASQPASGVATLANAILGTVDETQVSVIRDVFYEDNSLTVVSNQHPLAVKRSFVLTEPNRYIVDFSPAVLQSRSLLRAIPQSHPDITSIKTGQFDENTVRIVVQFSEKAKPVDISRLEDSRVLRLGF